jgi:peptidoglycan biosynthesis protein MviN/MurJ (putative lipid II flippase)
MISNFIFAFIYHIVRTLRKFNAVSFGHVVFSLVGVFYLLFQKRPQWFYYALIGLGGYAGIKHGYHLMLSSH